MWTVTVSMVNSIYYTCSVEGFRSQLRYYLHMMPFCYFVPVLNFGNCSGSLSRLESVHSTTCLPHLTPNKLWRIWLGYFCTATTCTNSGQEVFQYYCTSQYYTYLQDMTAKFSQVWSESSSFLNYCILVNKLDSTLFFTKLSLKFITETFIHSITFITSEYIQYTMSWNCLYFKLMRLPTIIISESCWMIIEYNCNKAVSVWLKALDRLQIRLYSILHEI